MTEATNQRLSTVLASWTKTEMETLTLLPAVTEEGSDQDEEFLCENCLSAEDAAREILYRFEQVWGVCGGRLILVTPPEIRFRDSYRGVRWSSYVRFRLWRPS